MMEIGIPPDALVEEGFMRACPVRLSRAMRTGFIRSHSAPTSGGIRNRAAAIVGAPR
jgi:hypothetical protein